MNRKLSKKELVQIKGNRCSLCGYSNCLDALEFHHMIPSEKDGIISSLNKNDQILEVNKCLLLCANCHRELHAKQRNIKPN